MVLVEKDELIPILERRPRINAKMWDLLDFPEDQVRCYKNGNAAMILSWGLGVSSDEPKELLPLLKEIPLNP